MKTHDTVVMGSKDGKVLFMKTYKYEIQKDEAQSDLKEVIDSGLAWSIGEIGSVELVTTLHSDAIEFVKEVAGNEWICEKLDIIRLDPKALLEGNDWHIEDDI